MARVIVVADVAIARCYKFLLLLLLLLFPAAAAVAAVSVDGFPLVVVLPSRLVPRVVVACLELKGACFHVWMSSPVTQS